MSPRLYHSGVTAGKSSGPAKSVILSGICRAQSATNGVEGSLHPLQRPRALTHSHEAAGWGLIRIRLAVQIHHDRGCPTFALFEGWTPVPPAP
jgi:hypothetical protein